MHPINNLRVAGNLTGGNVSASDVEEAKTDKNSGYKCSNSPSCLLVGHRQCGTYAQDDRQGSKDNNTSPYSTDEQAINFLGLHTYYAPNVQISGRRDQRT